MNAHAVEYFRHNRGVVGKIIKVVITNLGENLFVLLTQDDGTHQSLKLAFMDLY